MIKKSALLCALLLTSALFSCGSSDSKGDGSGHMYNAALLNNPQSLDPQFACDESSETVISNLYSRLMKLDPSGNPVCSNAESYEISPDGLTYTFKLRSDNYWFFDYNDDDKIDEAECFPVTAQDYVFAFRRILDPKMCSPF
ncbi:MAG: ABC transporter substrate-binding protein, partial [Ruminococcus sp.]